MGEGGATDKVCVCVCVCRLRSGGGIGDVLRPVALGAPEHAARFVYDTAFYYLIIVLLMNLLFGIIIDTFADLRTEKAGPSCQCWPACMCLC
jgi:hypothetical protein